MQDQSVAHLFFLFKNMHLFKQQVFSLLPYLIQKFFCLPLFIITEFIRLCNINANWLKNSRTSEWVSQILICPYQTLMPAARRTADTSKLGHFSITLPTLSADGYLEFPGQHSQGTICHPIYIAKHKHECSRVKTSRLQYC